MSIQTVIDALRLPASALVGQRIAKKLLAEQGAPTAADRRLINDAVDSVIWHAALKPTTVGVAAYAGDLTRPDVIELALVSVLLRPGVRPAQAQRLRELIHRAIPYPLLLVCAQGDLVTLSLADLRSSLGQSDKQVLQALHLSGEFSPRVPSAVEQSYLNSLAIDEQPRAHLGALYQGWIHRTVALQAARVTGVYATPGSEAAAQAQREALESVRQIRAEVASARAQAVKEKQLSRQVELNLRLQMLHRHLKQLEGRLTP